MSARPKKTGQGQQERPDAPKRRTLALVAGIAGAVVVVAIIVYAVLQGNRAVPGAAVATDTTQLPPQLTAGSRAPSFELHSKIGSFSSASLAGTPYLLEIFATWCPHCQRMTKVLAQIRARVPESKLAMLSVTGSPYAATSTPGNLVAEDQEDVDRFDSTYKVTWSSFLDADLTVVKKFGLNGFPSIFIVNGKGVIVYAGSGEVSAATLASAIHRAGG